MKAIVFDRYSQLPPAVQTAGKYLAIGACALAILKLAHVIVRTVLRLFNCFHTVQNFNKMFKNVQKAIGDHGTEDIADPTFSWWTSPLAFTSKIAMSPGIRESMQDTAFYKESGEYILSGVFDGHGDQGLQIAQKAMDLFKGKSLIGSGPSGAYDLSNMYKSFNEVFTDVDKIVAAAFPQSGATACICCIDKRNNYVFVATLGSAEAGVFRKDGKGALECIPLSPVRNWGHKKEIDRAEKLVPGIAEQWGLKRPVQRTFPNDDPGAVNVSRALGDAQVCMVQGVRAILCKPKVSVFQLQPGDVLVVATDGLWNKIDEGQLDLENYWNDADKMAEHLVDHVVAMNTENVAVVAIKAQPLH